MDCIVVPNILPKIVNPSFPVSLPLQTDTSIRLSASRRSWDGARTRPTGSRTPSRRLKGNDPSFDIHCQPFFCHDGKNLTYRMGHVRSTLKVWFRSWTFKGNVQHWLLSDYQSKELLPKILLDIKYTYQSSWELVLSEVFSFFCYEKLSITRPIQATQVEG